MQYKIFYLFVLFASLRGVSQNVVKKQDSKFSIYLESGLIPIRSLNTSDQLCYQGQLALNYSLKKNIQLGVFGQTMIYSGNIDLANIDNKIIELSSIEYNTCGLNTGYLFQFNNFILNPKLDISYNFFIAKSLDFPNDHNEFLDYRYLSLTPKVNLGYALSEDIAMGFSFGYSTQVYAFKGRILDEFNPNSMTAGIYASIPIR